MSAVANKLREARALIERGWTQGADARDAYSSECDPGDDEAVCWCANGAMFRSGLVGELAALGDKLINEAIGATPTLASEWPYVNWNDAPERTQAEVLAAFDKAIELAERGQ